MKRKSIAILLVLTMAATMFAGCGESKDSGSIDTAASGTYESTLKSEMAKEELQICCIYPLRLV